ncbi:hypothetical protein PL81_28470 [Streptomyces sp. RSD-27]|nr:hypothetical protein PL81_28470 [Streptomyces sp. RSD-27]
MVVRTFQVPVRKASTARSITACPTGVFEGAIEVGAVEPETAGAEVPAGGEVTEGCADGLSLPVHAARNAAPAPMAR